MPALSSPDPRLLEKMRTRCCFDELLKSVLMDNSGFEARLTGTPLWQCRVSRGCCSCHCSIRFLLCGAEHAYLWRTTSSRSIFHLTITSRIFLAGPPNRLMWGLWYDTMRGLHLPSGMQDLFPCSCKDRPQHQPLQGLPWLRRLTLYKCILSSRGGLHSVI